MSPRLRATTLVTTVLATIAPATTAPATIALAVVPPAAVADHAHRGLDGRHATARPTSPSVTWMSGTSIHVADGPEITVKAAKHEGTYLRLLGRTPDGWAVDAFRHVLVVGPDGTVLRRLQKDDSDEYAEEVLSDDGRHLLAYVSDQAGDRETHVYDTRTGQDVGYYDIDQPGDLRMYRNRIYAGTDTGLRVFTLGTTRSRQLAAHTARLIDTRHDLAFLGTGSHHAGPTGLAHPGRPAWSQGFLPRAVSPDASYVVGQVGSNHLVVRRVDDGRLVRRLPLTWDDGRTENVLHGDALGWEDSHTVLVGVRDARDREALERCDVTSTAACRRVTPWTTGLVSLPAPLHR